MVSYRNVVYKCVEKIFVTHVRVDSQTIVPRWTLKYIHALLVNS